MRIKDGFVLRKHGDEQIVTAEGLEHIEYGKAISLNPTAAYLWRKVEGKDFDIQTIAALLMSEYSIDEDSATNDARELLTGWQEAGLTEESSESQIVMDESHIDKTKEQLLSLLRAALWKTQVDTDIFKTDTDWHTLFSLAKKQTVLGLVYDSMTTLPESLQPDNTLLNQLRLYTDITADNHKRLNDILVEMVNRLKAEGIRTVLLKGQGVARNYPNPLRRECGDIDLYVGNSEYAHTRSLLDKWGMLDGDDTSEITHHLHFKYNGVGVEIHRMAGVLYWHHHQNLFHQWSDKLLQGDTRRKVEMNGTEVLLPPVRFDSLFLFSHLHNHFINGGVGLRQLCDWAIYLHTFHEDIDRGVLDKDLESFNLKRQWQVMGNILVHDLGLSEDEFPLYTPNVRFRRLAEKMMELVWQSGNFGHYDQTLLSRPAGYVAGKMHSVIEYHRYMRRVFPLDPFASLDRYAKFIKSGTMILYKNHFRLKP